MKEKIQIKAGSSYTNINLQQQREAGEHADRLLLIHATLDSTKRARLSREAKEGDRITGDGRQGRPRLTWTENRRRRGKSKVWSAKRNSNREQ